MVFESLIVDLINKYLGKYVVELDSSQLKVGLLSGNISFENIDIKDNAFNEFDLPVKIIQGHIDKLTLKIPWKHIYSEAVIAELDGLYILVIPNSDVIYNEEKEHLINLESKFKELSKIEEERAKRNQPKKEIEIKDSFGEKLAAQIVKNLQIIINNIHIRYENYSINPQRPFAIGITLANLSFQTCDLNGQNIVIKDDATREVFKSIKMDSLALYWKSKPILFNEMAREQLKHSMISTISSNDNKLFDADYLIQPISCIAMMHLHMRPEITHFTIPQMSLNVTMDHIGFEFNRNQYCDLASFLESIDRNWTKSQFRRYHPNVPFKGNIKAWWLFPYNVVVEDVRRKQKMWSWNYIHHHRSLCLTYQDLWKQKILNKDLNEDTKNKLRDCEVELDLLNINLCRQQADMKAKNERKKLNESQTSTGGWFSGWFGKLDSESSYSQLTDVSTDYQSRIRNELTLEEKIKFYQAIEYTEYNDHPDIPHEYVSLKVNITLNKLSFHLDDKMISSRNLLKLSIHFLSVNIERRSSADAMKVAIIMSSIQVNGSIHNDGVLPVLLSTQRYSPNDNLLNIEFEIHPLDQSANQKLNIRLEPLEIIYDSETIIGLVKFVTPPKGLRMYETTTETTASFDQIKVMSATGLRYIVDQHSYTDIKIDVKTSYFILPQFGSYKRDCKMLLVDLGSIAIKSENASFMPFGDTRNVIKPEKLDYDKIKETAYDKFKITLSNMQVLLIDQGDDWRKLRYQESSKNHILGPFGFNFNIKKCIISNDVNLPNIFINGCLPLLNVNISDVDVQSILDLMLHIPFPKVESSKVIPTKVQLEKPKHFQKIFNDVKLNKKLLSTKNMNKPTLIIEKVLPNSNLVMLDMVFMITTFELKVFQRIKNKNSNLNERKEIIKLMIDEIGITLSLEIFDVKFQIYVGGLLLTSPQFIHPTLRRDVCLLQTKHYGKHQNLFFVKLLIAKQTSPNFKVFYKNTLNILECNFKNLEVCVHKEALLLLLNFANSLLQIIKIENRKPIINTLKVIAKHEEVLPPKRQSKPNNRNSTETQSERNSSTFTDNVIQWSVTMVFDKLKINFSSVEQNDIFEIFIHGMRLDVKLTSPTTEVALSIADLRIQDPVPGMVYKKMLWIEPDESTFSFQIVLFNESTNTTANEFDLTKVDTMVDLKIGKVKIVFIYCFVNRVQVFLNSFQHSLQTIIEIDQENLNEIAVIENNNEHLSRMSLEIQIDAPIIYIPESEKSTNSLMLSIEKLNLKNHIKMSSNENAILDHLDISLLNVRLLRGKFVEKMIRIGDKRGYLLRYSNKSILLESTVENEHHALTPINININMIRNLSWFTHNTIPQVDVLIKMHSINVKMSQGDYSLIQTVLQLNFAEIVPQPVNIEAENYPISNLKASIIDESKLSITLPVLLTVKFQFEISSMHFELFKGDSLSEEFTTEIPPEKRLSKLICDKLTVSGKIYNNTAINVLVKLSDMRLLDTQQYAINNLNKGVILSLLKIKDRGEFISIKLVQDHLQNCKLSVNIARISICLCVEYLMQLTDFFVKAQPPPIIPPKKIMVAIRGHDVNPRKFRNRPLKSVMTPRPGDFEIDVQLAKPEIIIAEKINDIESNIILIQVEVVLKYSLLKQADIINAEINEFGVTFGTFNKKRRIKNSIDIILPTNITFYCNRPINEGMKGSLIAEYLIINITPALIQSFSKMMLSIQYSTNRSDDINVADKCSIQTTEKYESNEFWDVKEFEDIDFPFITKGMIEKNKIDDSDSNVEVGFDVAQMILDVEQRRADQGLNVIIYLQLKLIKVVLESEIAKKCVPILILECSMDGDLKNPLTQLSIGLTITLSANYFNDNIIVWEPLIEVYPEENNRQYCFEIEYITCNDTELFSEEDYEDLASVQPSAVSLLLLSRDNLEIIITKAAIDVLSNLGKVFEDAYSMTFQDYKPVIDAPYVIRNTCGLDILVYLSKEFDLVYCKADNEDRVILKKGREIQLRDAKVEENFISEESKVRVIHLGFLVTPNYKGEFIIYKSETRGLYIGKKGLESSNKSSTICDRDLAILVVQTTAHLGLKSIDLRSMLQVYNNSEDDIDLYYKTIHDSVRDHKLIEKVKSGESLNVPIPVLILSDGYIYLNVPSLDTNVSTNGALWKITKGTHTSTNQIIECSTSTDLTYFYSVSITEIEIPLNSVGNEDEIFRTYKINICSSVSLHNQLPIEISYQSHIFINKIDPGCRHFLRTASIDKQSLIKITFEYEKKEWFGVMELKPKLDELGIITFKYREGFTELTIELGVHVIPKNDQISVTIYSPYWMINKTGHLLTYKAGDDYLILHEANNQEVVLFAFLSKSIFSKKKINLKIADSSWSDKFSLDTVGSNGKVICKKKTISYEIGIKINLSRSGLTKIVTFMPYYMIINKSNMNLFCNELSEGAGWITVPKGEAVPFWPRSEVGKSMLMRCKVDDWEVLVTQPFTFFESQSILMKLEKKYVGIFVEIQITEEANLITLQLYQEGMALVQLVNHLGENIDIHYKQTGCNQEFILPPFHYVMYAWQDSRQKKELVWHVDGDNKKQHINFLSSDGIEDFYINEVKAYWVSFVLDMHRILLFTTDIYVAKHARLSTDLENLDIEITVSLNSIGLSLVDDSQRQEVAYISITSSGIKWNQVHRKNRFKPLKVSQSEALEIAYDEYVNKVRIGESEIEQHIVQVEDLEIDLSKKLMMKPEKYELSRIFEPGIYIQYRTSLHQMHLHLRIFRIQVDNQMDDCNFSVVFAPFPPPKSVILDAGLKPLIELSAVIGKTSESGFMRFKYFRVLIQEMQLMLDQGFINALLDFFSGAVSNFDEEGMFQKDCKMIKNRLIDTSTINSILQGGKKCIFDNFHISPIKIHLSFSLSRVSRTGKTNLHSDMVNLFLQSVGIAITDMQDVIFKLGYFEKQNSIMPMNQMLSSMTHHYVSQGLRQMYVLVLGLDVLGNPFGVIRGMAQGFEDLFYEPVRGAIIGPEEFAEGVAYGVKSLFGHAVGGAAGAVSRIVGTMGKGIAALTLDADYQRKRREQLARRPDNLGVGLAQGGKDLVMGIVQGFTGVVMKPIDGARKDGVEGFFKGVGKGLVGVVTRPISGVVDFASSSFEGIRRATDTNVEVYRIRPPRCINTDKIVRSYDLREAEGNTIWKKTIEKSEPLQDEIYIYHIYCKSKKNILFLTNKRILILERNEILGTWSIHWQLSYNKLDGTPTINDNRKTIVFSLKEKQRKFFSKDNNTKEIEADVESLKNVVIKVVEMMELNKV